MQRILFALPFLLVPAVVLAEDTTPVLPPPAHVQPGDPSSDAGAKAQTNQGKGLSNELSTKGDGGGDVQVYSKTREDGTKVEEYAHDGHVYMIKVTPPHGAPPYYLYENSNGKFVRHLPGGFNHPTPPEWVIKKF